MNFQTSLLRTKSGRGRVFGRIIRNWVQTLLDATAFARPTRERHHLAHYHATGVGIPAASLLSSKPMSQQSSRHMVEHEPLLLSEANSGNNYGTIVTES